MTNKATEKLEMPRQHRHENNNNNNVAAYLNSKSQSLLENIDERSSSVEEEEAATATAVDQLESVSAVVVSAEARSQTVLPNSKSPDGLLYHNNHNSSSIYGNSLLSSNINSTSQGVTTCNNDYKNNKITTRSPTPHR
jgi:hypothetical protein